MASSRFLHFLAFLALIALRLVRVFMVHQATLWGDFAIPFAHGDTLVHLLAS
jgi:hypothetical protein